MTFITKANLRKGYFIRKIILFSLWFPLVLGIMGSIKCFITGDYVTEDIYFAIFLIILATATFFPLKKFIFTKNQCVPYLNKLLTTSEINSLLEKEDFQRVDSLKGSVFYGKVKDSAHWMCVNGYYISKDLAIACFLCPHHEPVSGRGSSELEVMYLTGKYISISTGLSSTGKHDDYFHSYIRESTDIILYYAGINERHLEPIAKRMLGKEPYKDMNMLEIIAHANEIKSKCNF